MTNPPVQPLSAEDADWLIDGGRRGLSHEDAMDKMHEVHDALRHVRDGHHVVIERVTEAQAREAFQAWWCPPDHDENPSFFSHKAFAQDAWLAAYRHAGLLIEDKQS